MPRLPDIELGRGARAITIPIVYEDRSALILDKPAGWMLSPVSWQRTARNLQAAIESSITARDFWARSRNLRFLRFVHRLDTETSGLLLCAKSLGAVKPLGELFESRRVEKTYLAVLVGARTETDWTCRAPLAPDSGRDGRMIVSDRGKDTETHFKVLEHRTDARLGKLLLTEVRPMTGRTHQIRVHATESGNEILGDSLYGSKVSPIREFPLALRAITLLYTDPFTGRRVRAEADIKTFLDEFGFTGEAFRQR